MVTRRRRPRDYSSAKSKEGSYDDDDDRYVALHNMEKEYFDSI